MVVLQARGILCGECNGQSPTEANHGEASQEGDTFSEAKRPSNNGLELTTATVAANLQRSVRSSTRCSTDLTHRGAECWGTQGRQANGMNGLTAWSPWGSPEHTRASGAVGQVRSQGGYG